MVSAAPLEVVPPILAVRRCMVLPPATAERVKNVGCRSQESKQEAVEWEHRFLSQFDYAWNRRSNAQARHVALRQVQRHTRRKLLYSLRQG